MLISTYHVEGIGVEHHPGYVTRKMAGCPQSCGANRPRTTRRSKMRKLTLLGWGIVMLSLASLWNLPAQEVVAHIRGTVTDPSGAGVPGAEVKATNKQTQVSATVTTRDDGSYEFLGLAPATYEVIITKNGFRRSTAPNIILALNQI